MINTEEGVRELSEKIKEMEKRLEDLLEGKVELEVVESSDGGIAPRSKLRVMCE